MTRMNRLASLVRLYLMRRRSRALGITPPVFARPQQPRAASAPNWRLMILAEIDEKQGLIRPMAFITGTPLSQGRVVLELLGETGSICRPIEKPLTIGEGSPMLMLPDIPFPEGAIGDVTRWQWNARLENERGRVLARWSKRLASAGALNCEAELDL